MALNFKSSLADPVATDVGNITMQGRVSSKTIQMGLFTINENAVWAGQNQLQKESYPFATISIPVNRNLFKLQVGDPFLFSFAKYGISNEVYRVLTIRENGLSDENITIQAMEDIFYKTTKIENANYTIPDDERIGPVDYLVDPLTIQKVIEAPFVLSSTIKLIPLACRNSDYLLGFNSYLSIDVGASYSLLSKSYNLVPYGTLNVAYGLTYQIDSDIGIVVDFVQDQEKLETVSWAEVLAGNKNIGLLGNEIISFTAINPITENQYGLTGIIRGRFGTEIEAHSSGETFYVLNPNLGLLSHSEIVAGVDRKIKLVPYNIKLSGAIADATAIDISITGKAKTPYNPINFVANGVSFAARYDTDIVLSWSARKRGFGAGTGIPGIVLADSAHEGLFDIKVYVSSILVRTISDIDALTYTYTEAMNLSDNGSLASEIVFKLTNHITENGYKYESDQVEVTCLKN